MANKPENLKPYEFVKGNDPRRHKRQKGEIGLKTKLNNALDQIWKGIEGEGRQTALVLIDVMLKKAIKEGNEAMIKLIWEYLETKPTEYHDLISNGEPIFLPVDLIKKNGTSSGSKRNS